MQGYISISSEGWCKRGCFLTDWNGAFGVNAPLCKLTDLETERRVVRIIECSTIVSSGQVISLDERH